jgi:hypothetical protein
LTATFVSPLGEKKTVYGFWDGEDVWKIRFMPDIAGTWTFTTSCTDKSNNGLNNKSGAFVCTASRNNNRFTTHGAVKVSRNHVFLSTKTERRFSGLQIPLGMDRSGQLMKNGHITFKSG